MKIDSTPGEDPVERIVRLWAQSNNLPIPFADAIRAEERERCAKLCDNFESSITAAACAAAIRAGNQR